MLNIVYAKAGGGYKKAYACAACQVVAINTAFATPGQVGVPKTAVGVGLVPHKGFGSAVAKPGPRKTGIHLPLFFKTVQGVLRRTAAGQANKQGCYKNFHGLVLVFTSIGFDSVKVPGYPQPV